VAELPGSDPEPGILYAGAHHDTQAGSAGADDNASGVAALLELARVLAPRPRRRTIRLVSFGAEEQLSVGSAEYVRTHRRELRARGEFMLNFDSFGSHLGWTRLSCSGPASMKDHLAAFFDRAGLYTVPALEVVPYTDLFPFVAAGVPGVYLGRNNCVAGRFFHHRPDDDLTRVSAPLLAAMADRAADLLSALANARRMPFPSAIPADLARLARNGWRDLYGGWGGGRRDGADPGSPQGARSMRRGAAWRP
jgi:Zn-dependent M28 family amino/carboxypeptidase